MKLCSLFCNSFKVQWHFLGSSFFKCNNSLFSIPYTAGAGAGAAFWSGFDQKGRLRARNTVLVSEVFRTMLWWEQKNELDFVKKVLDFLYYYSMYWIRAWTGQMPSLDPDPNIGNTYLRYPGFFIPKLSSFFSPYRSKAWGGRRGVTEFFPQKETKKLAFFAPTVPGYGQTGRSIVLAATGARVSFNVTQRNSQHRRVWSPRRRWWRWCRAEDPSSCCSLALNWRDVTEGWCRHLELRLELLQETGCWFQDGRRSGNVLGGGSHLLQWSSSRWSSHVSRWGANPDVGNWEVQLVIGVEGDNAVAVRARPTGQDQMLLTEGVLAKAAGVHHLKKRFFLIVRLAFY